ncbi:MAG: HEAT repeat domain-containing protein, partial [Myxococcales bacterium]
IWVLLLPGTRQKFAPPHGAEDEVAALMTSPDPRVRALAAELAGLRPQGARYAKELIDRLDDADPAVRARAHESLVRIAGTDAGQGASAWRAVARDRGW